MSKYWEIIKRYSGKVNKYWLSVIVFVVVTFFIGDSTIMHRISYNQQISRYEKEIEHYTKEKERNLERLNALQSDAETLERFAREEYHMTKPDEELFLIVE